MGINETLLEQSPRTLLFWQFGAPGFHKLLAEQQCKYVCTCMYLCFYLSIYFIIPLRDAELTMSINSKVNTKISNVFIFLNKILFSSDVISCQKNKIIIRKTKKETEKHGIGTKSNTSRLCWAEDMFHCLNGISLLPLLAIYCCLFSVACMRDVQKVSLYIVHPRWWKSEV